MPDQNQADNRTITGQITTPEREPLPGLTVIAYDQFLGGQEKLGQAQTDAAGYYRIEYPAEAIAADASGPDLLLEVYDDPDQPPVHTIPTKVGAASAEMIDIVIPSGRRFLPAEFVRLTQEIEGLTTNPKRRREATALVLSPKDETYLAQKLARPVRQLRHWYRARALSKETQLDEQVWYGLLQAGYPEKLEAYLDITREKLVRTLRQTLAEHKVALAPEAIDQQVDRLREQAIDAVYTTDHLLVQLAELRGYSRKGDRPSDTQRRRFVHHYVNNTQHDEAFWRSVNQDLRISKTKTANLRLATQLSALVDEQVPVVEAIQAEGVKNLRALVGKDLASIVSRALGDTTPEEDQARIVEQLASALEKAYPTAVFAQQLAESPNGLPQDTKDNLNAFFTQYPDYDFRTTNIHRFLDARPDALDRLQVRDGEVLRTRLVALQRLFNITPDYQRFPAISVLLGQGLDSAHDIHRMGRSAFVKKYLRSAGDGDRAQQRKQAALIYNRASSVSARINMVYSKYGRAFNNLPLYALPALSPDPSNGQNQQVLKTDGELPVEVPEWRTLFDALDYWRCEHSQSTYSPAAYLADLLIFLKYATLKNGEEVPAGDTTFLDKLHERRPDILHTLLNGRNALTEIPYVDLVLEVLENEVHRLESETSFTLTYKAKYFDTLEKERIDPDLREAIFQASGILLDESAKIYEREKPDGESWTLIDRGHLMQIDKVSGKLVFTTYFQTSASARELAASAEHVRTEPYGLLKTASYPWILPFDLWGEQIRTYLAHLGVPRYRLMEVFQPTNQPANELDIATEYLQLSRYEREIITGADPGEHGLENNGLKHMMDRAHLSYKELTELFQAKFINFTGAAIDVHEDPDIDNDTIDLAGRESQLYRFWKLYHKLPWSVVELDKIIRLFNPGLQPEDRGIDEDLIVHIANILRIQEQHNIPLLTLLTWWNEMDHFAYPDQPSWYETLFLRPLQNNSREQADLLRLFAELPQQVTNLDLFASENESYKYLPVVQGASKLSLEDFLLIKEKVESGEETGLDTIGQGRNIKIRLTYANLSFFVALGSLCRTLRLSVREYYILKLFFGTGPQDLPAPICTPGQPRLATPQSTFAFLRQMQLLREVNLSVEELGYIVKHRIEPKSTVPPLDKTIQITLAEIQVEMQKIQAENPVASTDSTGELRAKLASFPPELFIIDDKNLFQDLLDIIHGTSTLDHDRQKAIISAQRFEAIFPDSAEAETKLLDRGLLTKAVQRQRFVLRLMPAAIQEIPWSFAELLALALPAAEEWVVMGKDIINGTSGLPAAEQEVFIDRFPKVFTDAQAAKDHLLGPDALADSFERQLFVLQQLPAEVDGTQELVREKLQLLFADDPAKVQTAWDIIWDTSPLSEAEQVAFVQAESALFPDPQLATEQLIGSDALGEWKERIRFVFQQWGDMATAVSTKLEEKLVRLLPPPETLYQAWSDLILGGSPEAAAEQEQFIDELNDLFGSRDNLAECKQELKVKLIDRGLLQQLIDRIRYVVDHLWIFSAAETAAERDEQIRYLQGVTNKLYSLYPEETDVVSKALAIIVGTASLTPEEYGGLTEAEQAAFIEQYFAVFMDTEEAIAQFVREEPVPTEVTEKLRRVWNHLYLKSYLVKKLAETFEIAPATIQLLLDKYAQIPTNAFYTPGFTFADFRALNGGQAPATDRHRLSLDRLERVRPDEPKGDECYFRIVADDQQPIYWDLERRQTNWALDREFVFHNKLVVELRDASPLSRRDHPRRQDSGDKLLGRFTIDKDTKRRGEVEFDLRKGRYRLQYRIASYRNIGQVFFDRAFLDNTHSPMEHAEQFQFQIKSYRVLHKLAALIRVLNIRSEDIPYVFERGPLIGWLDLAKLSGGAPEEESKTPYWLEVRRLVQTFQLQAWIGRRRSDRFFIIDLLQKNQATGVDLRAYTHSWDDTSLYAEKDVLIDDLYQGLGWNKEDLKFLTRTDTFFFASYADERFLVKLREAMEIIHRLGGTGAQVWSLRTPEVGFSQAQLAKNLVQAKYDHDRWLDIAVNLQNSLRQRQRDALQAYLIAKSTEGHQEPNDLYAYYLIDTEMEPCFVTSRIKQAIASVQLFIQRVLMNLEYHTGLVFDPEEAAEWEWRKNYRVWEANRKVFLYPENWIEPELRDDKSPFFKELEDELLQDDVTEESVERAYLNYLYKLEEVARLDIRAEYYEKAEDEDTGTLHVFGRTHGVAPVYYYRKWDELSGIWSPWEKIDLDIEGDHLMSIVHNGKLMLFWPVFKPITDKDITYLDINNNKFNPKFHSISYASSHRVETGNWLPKKTSKKNITLNKEYINTFLEGSINILYENETDYARNRCLQKSSENFYLFNSIEHNLLSENFYFSCYKKNDQILITPRIRCLNRAIAILPNLSQFLIDPLEFVLPTFKYNDLKKDFEFIEQDQNPEGFLDPFDSSDIYGAYLNNQLVKINNEENGFYLYDGTWFPIFSNTPSEYIITHPSQHFPESSIKASYYGATPFFYADSRGVFFIRPASEVTREKRAKKFNVSIFHYFPIFLLQEAIYHFGVESIFRPKQTGFPKFDFLLRQAGNSNFNFQNLYHPKTNKRVELREVICRSSMSQEGDKCFLVFDYGHKKIRLPESGYITLVDGTHPLNYMMEHFEESLRVCLYIENSPLSTELIDIAEFDNSSSTGWWYYQFANEDLGCDYLLEIGLLSESYYHIDTPLPLENFAFLERRDPYSSYNWELFFHIPLMIACRLSQNQKFAEAQQWFHYIFNPTETDTTNINDEDLAAYPGLRFWKIKPFIEAYNRGKVMKSIEALFDTGDIGHDEIAAWERDPFNPHLIARYRIPAYMRAVVIKYLDNLIAWADQLFRRDTMESINEATQLYILAAEILGRRPEDVPGKVRPELSFEAIYNENPLKDLEGEIYVLPFVTGNQEYGGGIRPLNSIYYFCFPKNTFLLKYWNTVADRLFKIRNCMNIEGVVRKLALYEPPIDPALLVRATAAGIDLSSALNDLYAPLPNYRFQFMLQKALELCNEVKGLGAALLSTLEKKDAEQLNLIRAKHEIATLKSVTKIKEWAIEEAESTQEGFAKAKELIELKRDFFENRLRFNEHPGELANIILSGLAIGFQAAGQGLDLAAGTAYKFPDEIWGYAGMGGALLFVFGGAHEGASMQSWARVMYGLSTLSNSAASLSGLISGYQRRDEDWDFQVASAGKELEQIEQQIIGAEIRQQMANRDLANHEQQIEQAEETEAFLKDKFTNQQLYSWMVSQTSSLYFQAYKMAYDLAKQAEKAYRHELAVTDTGFIEFGYWDSLKKGLLAGEKLHQDLRRMEVAYLEKNKREYELTKHVSLALLNPEALLQLRETGACFFDIPELLFDLDHPGQYMRRIKSVSLTIPCVTGPYTNISAKLTLLSNRVRKQVVSSEDYGYAGIEDSRFNHNLVGIQSIATSSAQGDSGLFELNFRDERYLPFEGGGAISSWRLELPTELRQFDYDTISDVIIHMNYTARDGGDTLRDTVNAYLREQTEAWVEDLAQSGGTLPRLFSLKEEFAGAWNELVAEPPRTTTLEISHRHFPYFLRRKDLEVSKVSLFFVPKDPDVGIDPSIAGTRVDGVPADPADNVIVDPAFPDSDLSMIEYELTAANISEGERWPLEIRSAFTEEQVDNVFMLLHYTIR